jgi:hypothetical protein
MDPVIVAGPWLLVGGVVFLAVRSLMRSGRSKNGTLMPDGGPNPVPPP